MLLLFVYMTIAPIINRVWLFYAMEILNQSSSFPNIRFILSLINFVLLYTLFGLFLRRKVFEVTSSKKEKRQKIALFSIANVFVFIITIIFF